MFRLRTTARSKRKSLLIFLMLAPAAAIVVLAVAIVVRGRGALQRAALTATGLGQLAFTTQTLDLSSRGLRGAIFEPVASKEEYTSGAFLEGDLYLAGPGGLTRVSSGEHLNSIGRTGFELPVAPIIAMTSGKLRGASGPQLFLATAGAGLLLLEPEGQDPPELRNVLPVDGEARNLTAVLSLDTGELLLGTSHHGVLLFTGNRLVQQTFAVPGVDSSKLQITALAKVEGDSYLVGTRSSGVFFVSGGRVRQANAATGMPDDEVESIAVADGHALVGTDTGTAEFDLNAESWVPERVLAKGVFSHALATDGRQLLVGTIDQGVQEFSLGDRGGLQRVAITSAASSSTNRRVDAFLQVGDEHFALADGTLLRRDKAGWTSVLPSTAVALTDRNISALAFAPDGTLYVGFFDRGLDLLSPDGSVRHLEDDHLFCINRLVLDPQRRTIAAATGDGLVLFDERGTPRQTLMRRDGLISDHVTDIAFTQNGTALATPAGITFLGPAGPESLYAFQGLVNNHVYALAVATEADGADRLMAGTLGGVSVLQAKTVKRNFTVNNSTLGHNWVTALLSTQQGNTLVGTYGAGLETLDGQGRFSPVELPNGTPRDLVINPNALLATATHFYAGTLGHGLLVYSQAASRWSVVATGLPSLNVTSFAARDGELYVGTDNGLVRIAEVNLP